VITMMPMETTELKMFVRIKIRTMKTKTKVEFPAGRKVEQTKQTKKTSLSLLFLQNVCFKHSGKRKVIGIFRVER